MLSLQLRTNYTFIKLRFFPLTFYLNRLFLHMSEECSVHQNYLHDSKLFHYILS